MQGLGGTYHESVRRLPAAAPESQVCCDASETKRIKILSCHINTPGLDRSRRDQLDPRSNAEPGNVNVVHATTAAIMAMNDKAYV